MAKNTEIVENFEAFWAQYQKIRERDRRGVIASLGGIGILKYGY